MIDTLLAPPRPARPGAGRERASGSTGRYAVATLHRPANVDTPEAARAPRGRAGRGRRERLPSSCRSIRAAAPRSGRRASTTSPGSRVVDPLGYLDFLSLVRGAAVVVTDSGGIQEETTVLDVPCLTLRPNTERPITITARHEPARRRRRRSGPRSTPRSPASYGAPGDGPPLWDGHAGERIAAVLERSVS